MPSKHAKKIIVVGAGPGGLTAAMLLAGRGFDVTVLEAKARVGGRNAPIQLGPYVFDVGPTFLMLKAILDEVFEESDRRSQDYLQFTRLEPMYDLVYHDHRIQPTTDRGDMKRRIAERYPGQEKGLDKYFRVEKRRFDLMYPCLQKGYGSLKEYVSKEFLRALPHLSVTKSLMDVLGDYFRPEPLRLAFTFQAKYLGMSPWECPGAFGLLSYIEHAYGVYHVTGGLSAISDAMARVVEEHGGRIRLNAPVRSLRLDGRRARGVELESGERLEADDVVINADFAHAMSNLVPDGVLKRWSRERLATRKYSCSTFMLYLGLDTLYRDLAHHAIFFADDYRTNVDDIFKRKRLSENFSFYIRNASVTDGTLAPPGHSALYVLVPVPNLSADIDWARERDAFRNRILDRIEAKTPAKDLRKHIVEEKVIAPTEWRDDYSVYLGATFNLGHNLSQMLYYRPHNAFEEIDHCYLVGGGTHPGSGLPTIYESGRITANLLSRKHNVAFKSLNLQI